MVGTKRTPGRPREISDEKIIEEIRRLSDGEMGPARREFREKAAISPDTAAYHFGSYNEAVEAANRVPRKVGGGAKITDTGDKVGKATNTEETANE